MRCGRAQHDGRRDAMPLNILGQRPGIPLVWLAQSTVGIGFGIPQQIEEPHPACLLFSCSFSTLRGYGRLPEPPRATVCNRRSAPRLTGLSLSSIETKASALIVMSANPTLR